MQFDLTPAHIVSVSAVGKLKVHSVYIYVCVGEKRLIAFAFRLTAAERQFESFNILWEGVSRAEL